MCVVFDCTETTELEGGISALCDGISALVVCQLWNCAAIRSDAHLIIEILYTRP